MKWTLWTNISVGFWKYHDGEVSGDNPKYTIQVNHIFDYKNTNKISQINFRIVIFFCMNLKFYKSVFIIKACCIVIQFSCYYTASQLVLYFLSATDLTGKLSSVQLCYNCRQCCHYIMGRTLILLLTVSPYSVITIQNLSALFSHLSVST